MDKYLLVIIGLIIFSILVILYIRIFEKGTVTSETSEKTVDFKSSDGFSLLE